VEGLRENDVEAIFYAPRLAHARGQEAPEIRRFRAFVPVVGLSRQRHRQMVAMGGNLMSFDLGCSLIKERRAAIIHTHTLGRIGGIARVAAKVRRVPLVVSIHGGALDLPKNVQRDFKASNREGWEWGKAFGWVLGSRLLFRDADCIIACNDSEATLLRQNFPKQRIFVQPHGVPAKLYREDHRDAARDAFPRIAGRQVILCVGRVDRVKNQAWLLEQLPQILKKHPGVLLVLAGPCTDEPYGKTVNRRIQELGLEKHILLTGGLPPNDPSLIGLMQESRTLVLPSLSETFGLVILEAWAAGAVTISSRTSGPSALIRHGENGWIFDLDDPEGFREGIDRILSDREMVQRMAKLGQAVSQQYSLTALASRMKRLYEELIFEKRCDT
ncbi:MAG TPA: glycosyltransferase family 4 protein, partial [Verrucomicrobiae bacterium]|jgi:glycosyltransferase involved in cell wall biosynthesis|nr:glycosyltransferase family 4 protein [Verrucomicrobiae bacterium]